MNAVSTSDGGHHPPPLPGNGPVPHGDVALGLQLCRASIMSLIRLQLAFERGDRTSAMEAIDRLHALDGETEQLVAGLPAAADDPRQTIAQILKDEKMAVAFEKLALASGINGPGLASSPPFLRQRDGPPAEEAGAPVAGDGAPAGRRLFADVRAYAARILLLLAIGAGTLTAVALAL